MQGCGEEGCLRKRRLKLVDRGRRVQRVSITSAEHEYKDYPEQFGVEVKAT